MFTHEFYQSGNSKTKEAKTTLKASFRFKNEVAPENREKVKERINYDKFEEYDMRYYRGDPNIATYLISNGASVGKKLTPFSDKDKTDYFYKNGCEYRINSSPKKLKFNIEVTSKNKKSLDEMLDLERLNKFILTGEK